jgi:hypothetical protein
MKSAKDAEKRCLFHLYLYTHKLYIILLIANLLNLKIKLI